MNGIEVSSFPVEEIRCSNVQPRDKAQRGLEDSLAEGLGSCKELWDLGWESEASAWMRGLKVGNE